MEKLFENPVEQCSLSTYAEQAYLNYAMYVVMDRALPRIGDGLKPVQRRIIYAMSELGLRATAKYKKSARTIGDVLGKFHPHGDAACYEAMVLMAQSFAFRYPLIDGQGNWGSVDDPKSFAAMRYTEARLTPFAHLLLAETTLGAVKWVPNFDGALQEPQVLPARLPQVLLNGATGIAVGMTTDIPPHNLHEIVTACVELLDGKGEDAVLNAIQGPDFAGGGVLVSTREEIRAAYRSGRGSLRMRAAYRGEGKDILITSLPPQLSLNRVMEQIAHQIQSRKLPLIQDLRDESDESAPVRLRLIIRSGQVDHATVMGHLFASTELERNVRVNFNLISINNRPYVYTLTELLRAWLDFRFDCVRLRTRTRFEKVTERLHILAGWYIAYLDIDAVIAIIRNEDAPKPVLMERFQLSERQAEAILELKLRHLAKLEEQRIQTEQQALETEKIQLEVLLADKTHLTQQIKKELRQDAKTYGDARRTCLAPQAPSAQLLAKNPIIANEAITAVLSQAGWIRIVKGHGIDAIGLSYKSGDQLCCTALGLSNQLLVVLDNYGRAYTTTICSLPTTRGQGEPLSTRFKVASNTRFVAMICSNTGQFFAIASDSGYGFISDHESMVSRHRGGKALLNLSDGAVPLPPLRVMDAASQHIMMVTSEGYAGIVETTALPRLARGKGYKMVEISARKRIAGIKVIAWCIFHPGQNLLIYCGNRYLRLTAELQHQYTGARARCGKLLPRGWRRITQVLVETNHENRKTKTSPI